MKSTRTWKIDDGEAAAKASPTFQIPPRKRREKLKPGDLVKLRFVPTEAGAGLSGERMWVEVTKVKGLKFVGKVANDPVVFDDLSCGDKVEFGPEHVINMDVPR